MPTTTTTFPSRAAKAATVLKKGRNSIRPNATLKLAYASAKKMWKENSVESVNLASSIWILRTSLGVHPVSVLDILRNVTRLRVSFFFK